MFDTIKQHQRNTVAHLDLLDQLVADAERQISADVMSMLKLPFDACVWVEVRAGSHTAGWKPRVEVRHLCRHAPYFAKVEGEWVWVDTTPDVVYPHNVIEDCVQPVPDVARLEQACTVLADKYGIPVMITDHPRAKLVGDPDSADDLRLIHPKAKNLNGGKIWYLGWDCPDYWYCLEDGGVWHLYWTDGAHGNALTGHAIVENPERFKGDFDSAQWTSICPRSDKA